MVATQFFYTLSLIAMLIAILFVTMYLLCIDDYYKISVLKWTGIDLIVAGNVFKAVLPPKVLMLKPRCCSKSASRGLVVTQHKVCLGEHPITLFKAIVTPLYGFDESKLIH